MLNFTKLKKCSFKVNIIDQTDQRFPNCGTHIIYNTRITKKWIFKRNILTMKVNYLYFWKELNIKENNRNPNALWFWCLQKSKSLDFQKTFCVWLNFLKCCSSRNIVVEDIVEVSLLPSRGKSCQSLKWKYAKTSYEGFIVCAGFVCWLSATNVPFLAVKMFAVNLSLTFTVGSKYSKNRITCLFMYFTYWSQNTPASVFVKISIFWFYWDSFSCFFTQIFSSLCV